MPHDTFTSNSIFTCFHDRVFNGKLAINIFTFIQNCNRYVVVYGVPNASSGLEIGVNIGQSDFLSAAGSVAGAIILPHSRNTMPFPEDYGLMLTPGVYNVISLRMMQVNRMPAPYGKCIMADVDTTDRDVYQETINTTYSRVVRHM